jgi:phage shock protein A
MQAMKFSIAWHEDSLENQLQFLARSERDLKRLQESVEKLRANTKRLERQIAEAKRRKRDGFDSERFMVDC